MPAVIAAAALLCATCGCGAQRTERPPAGATAQPGRPVATAPASATPAVSTKPAPGTDAYGAPVGELPGSLHGRRCGSWRQDPGEPVPACTPIRPLLAVARRFARVYVRYQTGHLTPAVTAGIHATCTPAFAGFLVSQPVTVPSGQRVAPERVTGVVFAGGANADVSWADGTAPGGQSQSGTAQVTLTHVDGRWLVAGARALL